MPYSKLHLNTIFHALYLFTLVILGAYSLNSLSFSYSLRALAKMSLILIHFWENLRIYAYSVSSLTWTNHHTYQQAYAYFVSLNLWEMKKMMRKIFEVIPFHTKGFYSLCVANQSMRYSDKFFRRGVFLHLNQDRVLYRIPKQWHQLVSFNEFWALHSVLSLILNI